MSAAEAAEAAENGVADPSLSAEEARREKLKKAGAEYFERVLAQSNRGREVALAPNEGAAATREPYDETFETVGAVVEGSKLYVLGTVFVVCQSAGMVFTKSSLEALEAPAILVFLHFLPLLCALWLLSVQGAIELRPFSGAALQGSLPSATITGLEAVFFFFSLSRCSLPVVLSWVTIMPHIIQVMLDVQLHKSQIRPGRLAGMLLGILATAAAFFYSDMPGMAGGAALGLWALAEALSLMWAACRRRPHLLVNLFGERHGEALQQLTEVEGSVDAATLTFMRHALPALPILALGLALGEASELIEHELSVPAVTMILLSISAFGLGIVTLLLISDGLVREAKAALAAAPPLGTAVVEAAVHGVASPLAFSGAVVAVLVGLVLRMSA